VLTPETPEQSGIERAEPTADRHRETMEGGRWWKGIMVKGLEDIEKSQ